MDLIYPGRIQPAILQERCIISHSKTLLKVFKKAALNPIIIARYAIFPYF